MPVEYGSTTKEEKRVCFARYGAHGKMYFYTCGDKKARKAAYDRAALQGRAIEWRRHGGGMMKTQTIKKLFGEKITGADVGVVSTLTMLGPWGVALIAAYLAGQGLVKLAEKIQAMRGPTTPTIPLTGEEEMQIRKAIQIMEAERFAQTYPGVDEWIREHPFDLIDKTELELKNASNALSDAISNAQANPPPNQDDKCRLLDKLSFKLRELGDKISDATSSIAEWRQHMISWAPGGWNQMWNAYSQWIDGLREEWGCKTPTPTFLKEDLPF